MSDRECGADPMRPAGAQVDTTRVIAGDSRYTGQAASPRPSRTRVGDRFDTMAEPRPVPPSPAHIETMDELREMEVATLRERVTRSEYEVDTHAVAGAILARLFAERPAPAEPGA